MAYCASSVQQGHTALAVFNSSTLRLQCSTAAHCAGSVQQWHTALAVLNSDTLRLQCSTAATLRLQCSTVAHCASSVQQRHTVLAVFNSGTLHWQQCSTYKTCMAHCAGSSATQSKTYIASCTGKWCEHKQEIHSTLCWQ